MFIFEKYLSTYHQNAYGIQYIRMKFSTHTFSLRHRHTLTTKFHPKKSTALVQMRTVEKGEMENDLSFSLFEHSEFMEERTTKNNEKKTVETETYNIPKSI